MALQIQPLVCSRNVNITKQTQTFQSWYIFETDKAFLMLWYFNCLSPGVLLENIYSALLHVNLSMKDHHKITYCIFNSSGSGNTLTCCPLLLIITRVQQWIVCRCLPHLTVISTNAHLLCLLQFQLLSFIQYRYILAHFISFNTNHSVT